MSSYYCYMPQSRYAPLWLSHAPYRRTAPGLSLRPKFERGHPQLRVGYVEVGGFLPISRYIVRRSVRVYVCLSVCLSNAGVL